MHGRGIFTAKTLRPGDSIALRTRHAQNFILSTTDEDEDTHYVKCGYHRVCTCALACEIGRFVNHSFAPNAALRWHRKTLYLDFIALVPVDSEVLIDYGLTYRFVRELLEARIREGLPLPPQYVDFQG